MAGHPLTAEDAKGSYRAFEDLASHNPFGVLYQLLVSPDGKQKQFTFIGRNFGAINDVSADSILADADQFYSMIAPHHQSVLREAEERAFRTLQPLDIEVEFVKPNGERRWFRLSLAPRVLPDGWSLWSGIQSDIHERKQAEDALKQSENRLALALETTQLGLWEFDLLTGTLWWDERVRAFYGVGLDEPISFETFQKGTHPDDWEAASLSYQKALEQPGGGDFVVEHRVVTKDGQTRWLWGHGRVLVGRTGQAERVLGTTLNITERKDAEMHRTLLLNELNHRVKNNFQTLVSILELQRRRSHEPLVQSELSNASRRIQSVFKAHQHLYAADGQDETLDISVYLNELCRSLSAALFGDGEIEVCCDIVSIKLDRDRAVAIGLIVNELVTNCAKHAFADHAQGRVLVQLARQDTYLTLLVSDNGRGFPSEVSSQKGLGSELVQALSRQLGGSLAYRSSNGTSVELCLPFSKEPNG